MILVVFLVGVGGFWGGGGVEGLVCVALFVVVVVLVVLLVEKFGNGEVRVGLFVVLLVLCSEGCDEDDDSLVVIGVVLVDSANFFARWW